MSGRHLANYVLVAACLLLPAMLQSQTATLTPTSLSFGNQIVNTTSAAQPVVLMNTGTTSLTLTGINASGNFSQTNNCTAHIAAGASCAISVKFTPTGTGTRTGTLTVTDSATNSPQTTSLSGIGILAVSLTPTSLNFGNQVLNTTSGFRVVTLTNNQSVALTITGKSTTGDFAQTNNCGTSLAAGASCMFHVTFMPTATGVRTGTLTVTDNAANSPQTTNLTGTGVLAVTVTPSSLAFGNQVSGTTSSSQAATVTNNQTTTLTITSIAASGDFGQTNSCGTSLGAGASCTVNVTFTPTATGSRTGTLTVTDNAVNSPQTASLGGTGISTPLPASFFAMDVNQNNTNDPWPGTGAASNVSFSTYRTLGSSIKWADVYDCANNAYVFDEDPLNTGGKNNLYKWMTLANPTQKVMFTAYYSPKCLVPSNFQNDTSCAFSGQTGGCDLPGDVLSGDATWNTFITHLATYFNTYFPGQLGYLEVWNEPNIATECNPPTNPNSAPGNCTAQSLTQMTKDALCVLKATGTGCTNTTALGPNVQIISPPPTAVFSQTQADCTTAAGKAQIAGYLQNQLMVQGVQNYADIIGYHGYVKIPALGTGAPDPAAGAACESDLIASVQAAISASTTKPIYDTEASWAADSTVQNATYFPNTWIRDLPNPITQQVQAEEMAFTGIYYLAHASNTVCASGTCNKVVGFSWYGWDFDNQANKPGTTGQFWDQYATPSPALTPAGVAYTNVYTWLNGASPAAPCALVAGSTTIWTCNFARNGTYSAQAVWDTSQSCVGTTCTTPTNYTIPAGSPYTQWRDLSGNVFQLNGATTVPIGLEPILLDTGSIP